MVTDGEETLQSSNRRISSLSLPEDKIGIATPPLKERLTPDIKEGQSRTDQNLNRENLNKRKLELKLNQQEKDEGVERSHNDYHFPCEFFHDLTPLLHGGGREVGVHSAVRGEGYHLWEDTSGDG